MNLSWIIASVCVLLNATKVFSAGHDEEKLGEFTFVCKDGWRIYKGNCYKVAKDVPMMKSDARNACQRQGAELLYLDNEVEYLEFVEGISPPKIWLGLYWKVDKWLSNVIDVDGGKWLRLNKEVSAKTFALWADNEPAADDTKACVAAESNNSPNQRLMSVDCMKKLPFVCKYPACQKGFVPCAGGEKCINVKRDVCDGKNDCEDKSDESDCGDSNTDHIVLQSTSGSFALGTINDNSAKVWVLEAPVGQRIKLTIPSMDFEHNVAFLEIWSGRIGLSTSTILETLTGVISPHSVYSNFNLLSMRLYATDLTQTISSSTVTWTTAIPEIFNDVKSLTATDSYQEIKFPSAFSDRVYQGLSLTWKIQTDPGQVVSFNLKTSEKSGKVPIKFHNGDAEDSQEIMFMKHYTSPANMVYIVMESSVSISKFTIMYKKGCDLTIDAAYGEILSPGYYMESIPNSLTCKWTLNAGKTKSLGMTAKFTELDIQNTDPRTAPSKESVDKMEVFIDGNSTSVPYADISGNDFIHASGGQIEIKFTSDITLKSKKFKVVFGVDCPALKLSPNTTISKSTAYYQDADMVRISCPTGYTFNLEKYTKLVGGIPLRCEDNGWNVDDTSDTNIPECQVVRCATPPTITNGFIKSATGSIYESEATYECSAGYNFKAGTKVKCEADGQWTAMAGAVECESQACTALPAVTNGDFNVTEGTPFSAGSGEKVGFNTVVEYSCNEGYDLVGPLIKRCDQSSWIPAATPSCAAKLKCGLKVIPHGSFLGDPFIETGDSKVYTCDSGYEPTVVHTNRQVSVTCQNNQTLDKEFECKNKDECSGTNSCDAANSKCVDTDGDFRCECLKGYMQGSDTKTCQDIKECDNEKGGCSHTCTESDGSYECGCPITDGYELFIEDGQNGYTIASSETGLMAGDIYRLNHTCVLKKCPIPGSAVNGNYFKNDLNSFHVGDKIKMRCNDGYHITPNVYEKESTCQTDGSWDALYNCTIGTCTVPTTPTNGEFSQNTVNVNEEVTLTCKWTATENKTRTAFCAYINEATFTKFIGDDISKCPEIDCLAPVMPTGATTPNPSSTKHLHAGAKFGFLCNTDYTKAGNNSKNGEVTCQANGRWEFGSLRCEGNRCEDPGTPGDATQIVTNYESGQELRFECNRDGFVASQSDNVVRNYTCLTTKLWSNDLKTNFPTCKDITEPTLTGCPTGPLLYDKMDQVNIPAISAADNSGALKSFTADSNMRTGDIILAAKTIKFTATDYSDNKKECTVELKTKDPTTKPNPGCPPYKEIEVTNSSSTQYKVKDFLSGTTGVVTASPENVVTTLSKIGGQSEVVTVTATNEEGIKNTCTFTVSFKAGACFEDTLVQDGQALRAFNADKTSCNSTCKANYAYSDGKTSKIFTCDNSNAWTASSVDKCILYSNPSQRVKADLTYKLGALNQQCLTDFVSTLDGSFNFIKTTIRSECSINWEVSRSKDISLEGGADEYDVQLDLKLLDITKSKEERDACLAKLAAKPSVFDLPNRAVSCSGVSKTLNADRVTMGSSELGCDQATYNRLTSADLGEICLPCTFGQSNSGTSTCTNCASNLYQDVVNQAACKECPTGMTPDVQQAKCIFTCQPGFTSTSGLSPCQPCAVDKYSTDAKTCTDCPTGKSTVGKTGMDAESKCLEKCPLGQYSATGFKSPECFPCPKNFYQNAEGQTACLECDPGKEAVDTGSVAADNCTDITDTCNRTYCSEHGTCDFEYHRRRCICDAGYKGETCETPLSICESKPCTNKAECVKGASSTIFTCKCRTDLDKCQMEVLSNGNKITGSTYFLAANVADLAGCKAVCIGNDQCLKASYQFFTFGKQCFLYNDTTDPTLESGDASEAVNAFMEKKCNKAFSGDSCEKDDIDDCKSSTCHKDAMCKDEIAAFTCLCPSTGGATGKNCDQMVDPCSSSPCKSSGKCISFDKVRYECTCLDGFTGKNCETKMTYCDSHPDACGYDGICTNLDTGYTCQCVNGFSGKNCRSAPNFCQTRNNCQASNRCFSSIDFEHGRCACESPYFEYVEDSFNCKMNTTQTAMITQGTNYYDTKENVNLAGCKSLCIGDTRCAKASYEKLAFGGSCLLFNSTADPASFKSGDSENAYMEKKCQEGNETRCNQTKTPCDGVDCKNGTCRATGLVAQCDCQPGFTGSICQHSIDDCKNVNCGHGKCMDLHQKHICTCETGYEGGACEKNIEDCPGNCNTTNGKCVDGVNGYTCICNAGYMGANCHIEINECLTKYPCKHGAACDDKVNGYTCNCIDGWTGTDCEKPADFCASKPCQNDGACYSYSNRSFCICAGGNQGDKCENLRDVCEVLNNTDLCVNGANCQNKDGSAKCMCPVRFEKHTCTYDEGKEYHKGGAKYTAKTLTSSSAKPTDCLAICTDTPNCAGVTYTLISNTPYCLVFEQKNIDVKKLDPSSSSIHIHYTRTCFTDYNGDACQFTKDWCSASNNPCKNNAKCKQGSPLGFTCECPDGYFGTTCESKKNPCDAGPCGNSGAKCKSTVTKNICQCPQGKVFTKRACLGAIDHHVLLVDTLMDQPPPSIRTSARIETTEISIMLFVRVHQKLDANSTILYIFLSDDLTPGMSGKYIAITSAGVQAKFSDVETIPFADGFGEDLFNGKWHHIGVSITNVGKMSCTIGVETSQTIVQLSSTIVASNVQIELGKGILAEYQDVTIWDKAFTSGNFIQAGFNLFTPPTTNLIQGWWNYILTYSSKQMSKRLTISLAKDAAKVGPLLNCTRAVAVKYNLADQTVTTSSVSGITDVIANIQSDSAAGVSLKHNLPNHLEWNYYSAMVIATDANNNYAVCRFPVYIRHNNCGYDKPTGSIDDGCDDGVCNLRCSDSSQILAAPVPKYQICGSLGSYNLKKPYQKLVLPSCTVKASSVWEATVSIQFRFVVACTSIFPTKRQDFEDLLKQRIADMDEDWPGICAEKTKKCTNLAVKKLMCSATISHVVELEFSLKFNSEKLNFKSTSTSLTIEEVLKITILVENKLDLKSIGQAVMIETTFMISTGKACVSTGNSLIGSFCAPCSKGRYYNTTTGYCGLCGIGTYQDNLAQESCKACADDKTTYTVGADAAAKCLEVCKAGSFWDGSKCTLCPRHQYQDQPGKNFCHHCKIQTKTASTGSNSETLCKMDCPAGEIRDVTSQNCTRCKRGFWRSLVEDDCQECDTGFSTMEGELAVDKASCSLKKCQLGEFFNVSSKDCEKCGMGYYQDELLQLQCKNCSGNSTTKDVGSSKEGDCIFFCDDGYKVKNATTMTCEPCERGTYKVNTGQKKFEGCESCPSNTTDKIASTSATDCSVPECKAGQYISAGVCTACEADYYSDVALPFTSTTCKKCKDNHGIASTETPDSETKCRRFCEAGKQLVNETCVECERGSFKNNTGDLRFGQCVLCKDVTAFPLTDEKGVTDIAKCLVPKCSAGQFVKTGDCENCTVDSYQPLDDPLSTVTCTKCEKLGTIERGTRVSGSKSKDQCLAVCEGGKEFNNVTNACQECPMGQYKDPQKDRFGSCMPCPTNYTTSGAGTILESKCDIRDCEEGTYTDNNECKLCPLSQYQDERRKPSCKPCGTDRGTNKEGAKSLAECQVKCGAGKQGTDTCTPCPDHQIKKDAGFGGCTNCTDVNYKPNVARTICDIVFCSNGYGYKQGDNPPCTKCANGTFKADRGNAVCEKCPTGYTTSDEGQAACSVRFCEVGKFLKNGDCIECPMKTYKDKEGNTDCIPCADDKTTSKNGSKASTECDTDYCMAGKYRDPTKLLGCIKCPKNKYQPDNGTTECKSCAVGKVTMTDGSALESDCVPECLAGQQYNSALKKCDACRIGFYKAAVGNDKACDTCPDNFITEAVGSTSSGQCTQEICRAGTYVKLVNSKAQCTDCPIGTYNSVDMKEEGTCTSCGTSLTTLFTKRTSVADCVAKCAKGEGLQSGTCSKCKAEFYNNGEGENPNLCKHCPAGFTSTVSGSTACTVPATVTTVSVTVTIKMTFTYRVGIDSCDSQHNTISIFNFIMRKVRTFFVGWRTKRYNGKKTFCNRDGSSIKGKIKSCKRRVKRAVNTDMGVELTFENASSTVSDPGDNDSELDAQTVIQNLIDSDKAELTTAGEIEFQTAGDYSVASNCPTGEKLEGGICVKCGVGEYGTAGGCSKCPQDTYQDKVGMTNCTDCPANTYTDVGGTALIACKTWCDTKPDHCFFRGKCTTTGRRTASCDCNEGYTGDRCASRTEPSSNMPVILGASIGGGGALLLAGLIAAGLYRCLVGRSNKSSSSSSQKKSDDEFMTPNPLYDNYRSGSQLAPMQPYPSIAYPGPSYLPERPAPVGYKHGPSVFDNTDEDQFIWQA